MKHNVKSPPAKPNASPVDDTKIDESIPSSSTFTHEGVVKDLDYYLKEIGLWWHKSKEGILMCSRRIAEARFDLSYSDWKILKQKLPFNESQILIFLNISESEVVNNPANAADMPGEIYKLYEISQMDQEMFRAGRESGKVHLGASVQDLRAYRESVGNVKRRPSRSGRSTSKSNGHDPASARPNGRGSHSPSTPFRPSESMKTAPVLSPFQRDYEAFKAEQATKAAQSTAPVVDSSPAEKEPAPAPEVSREELLALIARNCIIVPLEDLDLNDLDLVQEYTDTIGTMGNGLGFAKVPVLSLPKVKVPQTKAPESKVPEQKVQVLPDALIYYEYENALAFRLEKPSQTCLEIRADDGVRLARDLNPSELAELEKLPFNSHGLHGDDGRYREISLVDAKEWLEQNPRAAESRA